MSRRHRRLARRRAGMALVAALGLLMLAAALLAAAAVASTDAQRAARTLSAAAWAESEVSRSVAVVVQGWDAALDSMPVGAVMDRMVAPSTGNGPPLYTTAHVRRLGASLYAADVAVRVGDSAAPLAVRRLRAVLRRGADTLGDAGPPGVTRLSRWSVAGLP